MRVIAIEEHWTTEGIDQALRAQPPGSRDESLAWNDRGDISECLLDIGERRIDEMDAAGIDPADPLDRAAGDPRAPGARGDRPEPRCE